jgi:hypothetical protein
VLRGPTESFGDGRGTRSMSGFMDRTSGDMTVIASQKGIAPFTKTYTLKCRPAQRMF